MGVIYPQAVKIKPIGSSIQRYKNLNYNIPMKKASDSYAQIWKKDMVIDQNKDMEILIDDLPDYSMAIIWYTCDCCGELNYITKARYTIHKLKIGEKIYCNHCAHTTMNSGPFCYKWNPNKTDEERIIGRDYEEYYSFIKKVMARDEYTCQVCGLTNSSELTVHHLNGYNWDIEHRTDENNGITLCNNCHGNFHSLYGKGNNTKEQFEEWIGYRIELKDFFGEIYRRPKVYCIEDKIIYDDRFDTAKKLNCSPQTIADICGKRAYTYLGKHYIYYDEFVKKTDEEITELLSKGRREYQANRQVICITTGEKYSGSGYAAKNNNIKCIASINNACDHKQKYTGRKTGNILQWMWHRDFEKLSLDEQLNIASQNISTLKEGSFLYNLLKENTELID